MDHGQDARVPKRDLARSPEYKQDPIPERSFLGDQDFRAKIGSSPCLLQCI